MQRHVLVRAQNTNPVLGSLCWSRLERTPTELPTSLPSLGGYMTCSPAGTLWREEPGRAGLPGCRPCARTSELGGGSAAAWHSLAILMDHLPSTSCGLLTTRLCFWAPDKRLQSNQMSEGLFAHQIFFCDRFPPGVGGVGVLYSKQSCRNRRDGEWVMTVPSFPPCSHEWPF